MRASERFSHLSDVIGVSLFYKDGKLSGTRKAVVNLPVVGEFPLTLEVKAFFINEQAGVILHVAGDLCLLAGINPKSGIVSVFLINGRAFDGKPWDLITPSLNLKEALYRVRPGVVASFTWSHGLWAVYKVAW